MDDPFDLQRFVDAQAQTYVRAIGEIRAGAKTSHWMWFVFPQLKGMGSSATAQHYGIASLDEARAYLSHPLLGPRLRESAAAVAALAGRSARAVFGSPDDLKLRSSLTLFEIAAPDETVFGVALDTLCEGVRDERTLAMLRADGQA